MCFVDISNTWDRSQREAALFALEVYSFPFFSTLVLLF